MPDELFAAGPADQPLAARLAPQALEDFSGQEHLLGPGKMLRRLIEANRYASALFFGPPGSGKTALARFIAPKGSVAVDGVSLTVNEVQGSTFGVNIIPHTAAVTRFGTLKPGDKVNIEIDTLARYVARLQEYR